MYVEISLEKLGCCLGGFRGLRQRRDVAAIRGREVYFERSGHGDEAAAMNVKMVIWRKTKRAWIEVQESSGFIDRCDRRAGARLHDAGHGCACHGPLVSLLAPMARLWFWRRWRRAPTSEITSADR